MNFAGFDGMQAPGLVLAHVLGRLSEPAHDQHADDGGERDPEDHGVLTAVTAAGAMISSSSFSSCLQSRLEGGLSTLSFSSTRDAMKPGSSPQARMRLCLARLVSGGEAFESATLQLFTTHYDVVESHMLVCLHSN